MSNSTNGIPQLLSLSQTAKALGISRTTLNGLLREGFLRRVKIGRRTLVTVEDLQHFIRMERAWAAQ